MYLYELKSYDTKCYLNSEKNDSLLLFKSDTIAFDISDVSMLYWSQEDQHVTRLEKELV